MYNFNGLKYAAPCGCGCRGDDVMVSLHYKGRWHANRRDGGVVTRVKLLFCIKKGRNASALHPHP